MAEIIQRELFENGEVVGYKYGGRLVRCNNCKWWKSNYTWSSGKYNFCAREEYEPLRNGEDFCSYGEMKGETKMAIKDRQEEKKICEDIINALDKSHKLIDVDAFRHRLLCQPPKNISINRVLELVSTMPTVDAEIVNHGRWVGREDQKWHCSECNGIAPKGYRYNYCPDCGAKMDEVES